MQGFLRPAHACFNLEKGGGSHGWQRHPEQAFPLRREEKGRRGGPRGSGRPPASREAAALRPSGRRSQGREAGCRGSASRHLRRDERMRRRKTASPATWGPSGGSCCSSSREGREGRQPRWPTVANAPCTTCSCGSHMHQGRTSSSPCGWRSARPGPPTTRAASRAIVAARPCPVGHEAERADW